MSKSVLGRVQLLDEEDWSEDLRPIALKLHQHYLGLVNLHRLLALNSRLFRPALAFAARILDSSLEPRLREILILRTAFGRGVRYEWAHHAIVGRAVGLSDKEILALARPPEDGNWTGLELALIRAVDQLIPSSNIDDRTWDELAQHLDHSQLIEVVMTVGTYVMLGMALETFQVPLDFDLVQGSIGLELPQ